MSPPRLGGLALAVVILLVSACTSLSVKKVDPDDTKTPGVRYSLPQVFLKATPAADGGITVIPEYLPDSSQTFAASGRSFFASHELNITVANGMLKSVAWNQDTSAVAAEAVRQANTLATERLNAEKQQAKEEAIAITNARKALADAELGVTKALINLNALEAGNASPEAIRSAMIAYQQAVATRDAAQHALDELLGTRSTIATSGGGASNTIAPQSQGAGGAPASQVGGKTANPAGAPPPAKKAEVGKTGVAALAYAETRPGPVLYVLEDHGTPMSPRLHLRAVGDYKISTTLEKPALIVMDDEHPHQPGYRAPRAPKKEVAFLLAPRPSANGALLIHPNDKGLRVKTFVPSTQLKTLRECKVQRIDPSDRQKKIGNLITLKHASLDGPLQITIEFEQPGLDAGIYQLFVHASDEDTDLDDNGLIIELPEVKPRARAFSLSPKPPDNGALPVRPNDKGLRVKAFVPNNHVASLVECTLTQVDPTSHAPTGPAKKLRKGVSLDDPDQITVDFLEAENTPGTYKLEITAVDQATKERVSDTVFVELL